MGGNQIYHDSSWYYFDIWVAFDAIVQGDYVQTIQQLSLVLVDPFHLNVEQRGNIYFDVVFFLQDIRQEHFVFRLYRLDWSNKAGITCKLFEFSQLI